MLSVLILKLKMNLIFKCLRIHHIFFVQLYLSVKNLPVV